MLHGDKDILQELVTIGFYGIIITALVLGGIIILRDVIITVPIAPGF